MTESQAWREELKVERNRSRALQNALRAMINRTTEQALREHLLRTHNDLLDAAIAEVGERVIALSVVGDCALKVATIPTVNYGRNPQRIRWTQ